MVDIITSLQNLHKAVKPEILSRLNEFRNNKTDEKIEKEFFFCLLTPQCKARVCWENVERLYENGLLSRGSEKEISMGFNGVRFRNNKARYIVEARKRYFGEDSLMRNIINGEKDPFLMREYIVKNVRGMGYKEASHFLRNTGRGFDLAILDRHILRGLFLAGVISEIPGSLSGKKYKEIEKAMAEFASSVVSIPMPHLDFVFWHFFNGEVFK